MAKKKDENPFNPPPATEVKPADLVAENIPPAKTIDPAPSEPIKPAENLPEEKTTGENSPPVAEAAPAPEIPAATVVTPSQLVTEEIPAASLPPVPGQPRRGRGRPSLPFPECKKCGRKHKAGSCVAENGASQIVIPNGAENQPGAESIHDNPIEEKPAVNYRQLAEVCFDLSTNTAGAIIGPEWRAQDDKEREGMLIPLEMYLRAQEVKDIPPGAILCFAIAGYATARFRVPNTRTKFTLAWAWIKSKMPGKRSSFVPRVVNGEKDGNPFSVKN